MYLSYLSGRATVSLGIVLIVAGAAFAQSPSRSPHGDPVRGKALYQGCTGCHSLDDNDVGPRHGESSAARPDPLRTTACSKNRVFASRTT
jgi:cytochrome c